MGWSTSLFCNIEFNRKSYNSLYEVELDISEIENTIQLYKDKIKAYATMTEPDKVIKFDEEKYDNLLLQVNDEISTMLEELEEYFYELMKLEYLQKNWDNCHDKNGVAIAPPDDIHWDTAYLEGDFIKTNKSNIPGL